MTVGSGVGRRFGDRAAPPDGRGHWLKGVGRWQHRTTAGVPLCDLQAQYRELQPQIEAALARVLASGQVILGPEVAALEEEVAALLRRRPRRRLRLRHRRPARWRCTPWSIGPGDEVILPTFTFFATAGSVCRTGARPVFVDIDPVTYNLDPLQVESKITPRTRAIMAVHLFGQCADMEPLWQVAERHDLVVIEDAAQALGPSTRASGPAAWAASAASASTRPRTSAPTATPAWSSPATPSWAERMACLRVHGMEPKYYHKYIGWNARLDALQAAMLRVKLPHLERWIEAPPGRGRAATTR